MVGKASWRLVLYHAAYLACNPENPCRQLRNHGPKKRKPRPRAGTFQLEKETKQINPLDARLVLRF